MSCLSGTSDTCLSTSDISSHHSIAGTRDSGRLTGRSRHRLRRITLALGVWALSLGSAHAALIYDTSIVSFTNTASVTDAEGNPKSTSNDNASLGTSDLEQFDATFGVLTGVTINLDSTRTQSVTVASTAGGGNGNNNDRTTTGSGKSTAGISAPGVSYTFTTEITASGDCTGPRYDTCSNTTTATAVPTTQNLSATGSLNSYVGSGTVAVDLTAPTLSASQSNGLFTGDETTQYELTWTGDLSATYTYLKHAAPSFNSGTSIDSLALDFGSVVQNSSVNPLDFSIFNLANPDRTDLDLISFTATGDSSVLDSGLTTFTNLSQGTDQLFYATLDTTNPGSFSVTYKLTLSDAANIGAADSQHTYYLYLTLTGIVGDVTSVPVPDTVWLFGSGLIGIVGIARHNKPLDS